MSSAGGRKLADLRVCDLKDELEKRSLETTGNKTVLVERLQKVLKEEGANPDTHIFVSPTKRGMPAKKMVVKIKTEEPDPEPEHEESAVDDDGDDGDVVVVDEIGTVDEDDHQNTDPDMNDNEESINLTIGEDEQQLLHAQAQDGKDDKDDPKTDDIIGGINNGVVRIKQEKLDDELEGTEKKATGNADEPAENKEAAATTEAGDVTDEQNKDDSELKSAAKSTSPGDEDKDKAAAGGVPAKKTSASSSRNLWVSGLSSLTRAGDLKTIFTKYGKVIGAKVVTNTRTPGTRCYGYVTMASSADATRCIEHLHRTELHGRIISVERTKSEIGSSVASAAKKDDKPKPPTGQENGDGKEDVGTEVSKDPKKSHPSEKGTSIDRRKSDVDRSRKNSRTRTDRRPMRPESRGRIRSPIHHRPRRSMDRDRKRDVLSFQKIREERERQRMREREREMREAERRRREIRRRQREEEERLAREREKLRLERERLEREKAELLRLERERHKLEREKIEMERIELKRQQMKILQRNEDAKRSLKRPADDRFPASSSHSETKRSTSDRRFEAPPPPRFDSTLARSTDKKRDEYSSSSKRDDYKRDIDATPSRHTSSSYHSSRDTHKESRYSIPDPPRTNFRRDDRESRTSGNKRFDGPSYTERSSGGGNTSSSWHNAGPPTIKSFAASQMTNNVPSWQSKSSENNTNHWPSQDRYDRTYNERSGPYMDPSSRQSGMFVGSGGGRPQDRYGGQMSRYENGKY